jgi:hypothetical protein
MVEASTESEARDAALAIAARDYQRVEFVGISRAGGAMWAVQVNVWPEVLLP